MDDIPIYTIHDNIEIYDGGAIEIGEYFVKDVVLPFETTSGEKINLSNCFRSHATVKYLLEKGIIRKDNIVYMYKSKCSLKSDTFKEYVDFCYEKFGNDAKELINRFIGGLGTKYAKSFRGYMTASREDVLSTWLENKDSKMIINKEADTYLVKLRNESLKIKNDTSIWRHVIDAGVVKMIEGMFEVGSKIAGLSTDCIMVSECEITKIKKRRHKKG